MGLFGDKIELKREYFLDCHSNDKNKIISTRNSQGFKVTQYSEFGNLKISAVKKQFISTFEIINTIFLDGTTKCEFKVYESIKRKDFNDFLERNFTKTPQSIRFKYADGIRRAYYETSYFLPDGNIIKFKNEEGGTNWYTFETLDKKFILSI